MRLASILLIALSACVFSSANELSTVGDDSGDPPPFGSAPGACVSDDQCTLTSATCCECPTFATSIDDPKLEACGQVDCDNDSLVCPTNVEATCNLEQNQCELACAQLECLPCPNGYFLERNGCLSCTCESAPTSSPSCSVDSDCERVRADCCGCDAGGDDTSVATADKSAFDAALNCPAMPQCPGQSNVNEPTCNEVEFTPRCARGECALLTEEMPADACGRSDLPPCPPDKVCKINVNDSANLYGVGVCVP